MGETRTRKIRFRWEVKEGDFDVMEGETCVAKLGRTSGLHRSASSHVENMQYGDYVDLTVGRQTAWHGGS